MLIRRARISDCEILWKWANEARPTALDTEPISWFDHTEWFARQMNDERAIIFIVMKGQERVGQVRLNWYNHEAEVDVFIGNSYRGGGLGSGALVRASDWAFKHWSVNRVVARIKPNNIASVKAFLKAGFNEIHANNPHIYRTFVNWRI